MPILDYSSYSQPAYEGEVPHKESGAIFAGVEDQIINRSDLQAANYAGFNPGNLIPYGRFVYRQTASADGGVNLALCPNAAIANATIVGVSVGSYTREKKYTSSHNNAPINSSIQLFEGYEVQEPVIILRKGLVWMFSETILGVGSSVFVRCSTPTANTNQAFGRVRNAVSTANDTALTNAQAQVIRPNTNSAGGFALIQVDFTANTLR